MKGRAILFGKNKYIMAAIALILVLSVAVSFCVWDTTSLDKLLTGGRTANYYKTYDLLIDSGTPGVADLGDIVTFGNYYQLANQDTKSPVQWVVADIRQENGKSVLYLVSKYLMAVGSMSGTSYRDEQNNTTGGVSGSNQCYNESSMRAWLNSTARTDNGEGFTTTAAPKKIMNGFYNEAFNAKEQAAIIPRNLGSMTGYSALNNSSNTLFTYPALTSEKVWTLSHTEISGGTSAASNDSPTDKQFALYAKDTSSLATGGTVFSTTDLSCYDNSKSNYAQLGSITSWTVRTPAWGDGSNGNVLVVPRNTLTSTYVDHWIYGFNWISARGVRPAICLER